MTAELMEDSNNHTYVLRVRVVKLLKFTCKATFQGESGKCPMRACTARTSDRGFASHLTYSRHGSPFFRHRPPNLTSGSLKKPAVMRMNILSTAVAESQTARVDQGRRDCPPARGKIVHRRSKTYYSITTFDRRFDWVASEEIDEQIACKPLIATHSSTREVSQIIRVDSEYRNVKKQRNQMYSLSYTTNVTAFALFDLVEYSS
ncbi:hypothetical protein GGU10DRAFT_431016 [Lentinula aff. detonsa]|uniref:Uncharacterized protein n=1 Tax=Lentinula aff. detonsa TaxID=2804958 RepID=A0AA38U028_9AGAR|nr:hypothetical protein GGU10DRAFT_431016 [Lentinula aff. detonsa]